EECDDGNNVDGDGCAGCVACTSPGEFQDATTHHCYLSVANAVAWDAARAACIGWGGDLAGLSSIAERQLVGGKLATDAWIGGTDVQAEGTFVWCNGEPWLAAWSANEPNNGAPLGPENCVELAGQADTFNDLGCGS